MGASFTNCNVRTTDTAKCAKVLKSSSGLRALLTDSQNGWVTVYYDEQSESQDIEILRRLAKKDGWPGMIFRNEFGCPSVVIPFGDLLIGATALSLGYSC